MMKRTDRLIRLTACLLCGFFLFLPLSGCTAPGQEQHPEAPEASPVNSETLSPASSPVPPSGDLIMFLNVGKADATVIRSSGEFYIVDTGTAESVPALFGALHYLGADSVKAVFITHSHSDHVGGLNALLSHYRVETVYRSSVSFWKEGKQNPADKAAAKAGMEAVLLSAGDTVGMGSANSVTVLGPLVLNTDDDNDNSLVLDLSIDGKRIMLAGDMQFAEEETLIERYGNSLKTDILRIGNHGNPDATGPAFAAAADPDIIVISTDRNADTDSANERVLSLFEGKQILITDESDMGFLIPLDGSGSAPENVRHSTELDLVIVSVDKETQTATIRNNGSDADLSGCMLFSEKGNELFVFPDGAFLASGASCTVSGENGSGDYRWPGEKKPWNANKDDPALLFDSFGNLLSAVN